MSHPTVPLDDVVHQRVRLGVLTVLASADRADFTYLRTTLDVTAGNLSRHIDVLQSADLVTVEKGYENRRPRTWVRITRAGSAALRTEMRALRELLDLHDREARGT